MEKDWTNDNRTFCLHENEFYTGRDGGCPPKWLQRLRMLSLTSMAWTTW